MYKYKQVYYFSGEEAAAAAEQQISCSVAAVYTKCYVRIKNADGYREWT